MHCADHPMAVAVARCLGGNHAAANCGGAFIDVSRMEMPEEEGKIVHVSKLGASGESIRGQ